MDDIVAWNLGSFGLIKVLADGICSLARTATGKAGVTSGFALRQDLVISQVHWAKEGLVAYMSTSTASREGVCYLRRGRVYRGSGGTLPNAPPGRLDGRGGGLNFGHGE